MKILLNGYFYKNLGDDLFFHLITDRYPQHTFYVPVHADHASAYTGKSHVKILPQTKWKRGVDKLLGKLSPKLITTARLSRRTDVGVLIGGSMFQELGDAQRRLARMPRHPKGQYVLGINFGPHKTQGYVDGCRDYLKQAADVCFRDSLSYSHFAQLPNTRLGSDMVFDIHTLCPVPTQKQNTCVISLMDFASKEALAPYAADYFRFLTDTVGRQQALGRQVILVSFCKTEGDEQAIDRFLFQCPQELRTGISTLCYDGTNHVEVCNCIASSALLIATRFHSMVLGLAYGIPTVPISYSNKTLQLLQDLGYGDFAILPGQLATARADHPVPPMDISSWVQKSREHFRMLDARLAERS